MTREKKEASKNYNDNTKNMSKEEKENMYL